MGSSGFVPVLPVRGPEQRSCRPININKNDMVAGRVSRRHGVTRDASRVALLSPAELYVTERRRPFLSPPRSQLGSASRHAIVGSSCRRALKALVLLALALVRTLLRRLFGGGRGGLAAFRENYAADGLAPVTAEQRTTMNDFGNCIACGLCDRGEGARIARSGGAYPGVMELMLAASRSMPDFGAAAVAFAYVSDEVLQEKEKLCPTSVPMRKIAAFVRDKAGESRTSLPVVATKALPAQADSR